MSGLADFINGAVQESYSPVEGGEVDDGTRMIQDNFPMGLPQMAIANPTGFQMIDGAVPPDTRPSDPRTESLLSRIDAALAESYNPMTGGTMDAADPHHLGRTIDADQLFGFARNGGIPQMKEAIRESEDAVRVRFDGGEVLAVRNFKPASPWAFFGPPHLAQQVESAYRRLEAQQRAVLAERRRQ